MTVETERWDITEFLDSEEAIADYLAAVFQDGDSAEIRRAINHIARARGMSNLAKEAGLSREALYKALGDNGNPTLDTLLKVTKALGVKLSVLAQAA